MAPKVKPVSKAAQPASKTPPPVLASPVAPPPPKAVAVKAEKSANFYNGPTVKVVSNEVKDKAAAVSQAVSSKAPSVDAQTKQTLKKSTAKAQAASRSFTSFLFRSALVAFFLSLFLCPPIYNPATTPGFCAPASRWHSYAQPYVQPHIDSTIAYSKKHFGPYHERYLAPHVSAVRSRVEPIAASAVRVAKPHVRSTQRAVLRLYRHHVEPRLRYATAQIGKVVRPYVTEIELRWKVFVEPHFRQLKTRAVDVWAKVEGTKRLRLARTKSAQWASQAYAVSEPLASKGYRFARHHVKHTVVPLSATGYALGKEHGSKAAVIAFKHLNAVHRQHIRPALERVDAAFLERIYQPSLAAHLDPILAKVAPFYRLVSKHLAYVDAKVEAFVLEYFYRFFPNFAPAPPTFIQNLTDKVSEKAHAVVDAIPSISLPIAVAKPTEPTATPVAPAAAAAQKPVVVKDEDEDAAFLVELENAKNPSMVDVPSIPEPILPPLPDEKNSEEEKRTLEEQKKAAVAKTRAEIFKKHDDFEAKIKTVGEFEEAKLVEKLVEIRTKARKAFPVVSESWAGKLEKDVEKAAKSLEKYLDKRKNLSIEDIEEALAKAQARYDEKLGELTSTVDGWLAEIELREETAVYEASDKIDKVNGEASDKLGMAYSWLDDVTVEDWKRYHKLAESAQKWHNRYSSHSNSDKTHPRLASPEADIDSLLSTFREEVDLLSDGFLARLGRIKNSARKSIVDQDDDASDEPFDALPIWDAIGGAAAAGAGGVLLSKGKEQVLSALSQANEAVASTPTPTDLAQEALDGALNRAHHNSENARAEVTAVEHFVEAAVASASSLAFGAATTNAGNKNVVAAVESAYEAALSSASSVLSDASVFMHSATRSAIAAAGYTPVPETPSEHLNSVLAEAGASASSVYSQAAELIHAATRSGAALVGATPAPETPAEHVASAVAQAQSLLATASASLSSVLSVASASSAAAQASAEARRFAEDAADTYVPDYADLYERASSSVHSATRALSRAAGATPTPETPQEYVESVLEGGKNVVGEAWERVAGRDEL